MKLRSNKTTIELCIPSELDQQTLPHYLNSDDKWKSAVLGAWDPRKWQKRLKKIWRSPDLTRKEKETIGKLMLGDMKKILRHVQYRLC